MPCILQMRTYPREDDIGPLRAFEVVSHDVKQAVRELGLARGVRMAEILFDGLQVVVGRPLRHSCCCRWWWWWCFCGRCCHLSTTTCCFLGLRGELEIRIQQLVEPRRVVVIRGSTVIDAAAAGGGSRCRRDGARTSTAHASLVSFGVGLSVLLLLLFIPAQSAHSSDGCTTRFASHPIFSLSASMSNLSN